MKTPDLFNESLEVTEILPNVFLLKEFVSAQAERLMETIKEIEMHSAFRNMQTPGGFFMSTAMTNCGAVGWHSDRKGYRYAETDPQTGRAWPEMPENLLNLAQTAAQQAKFANFMPDVCLINRYEVGARMGLHQDKDEVDYSQPIVSVSLGLPVVFQFGGMKRHDPKQRITLEHGDVIVWGGVARRFYHAVLSIKPGNHPITGPYRFNLTFRKAR